MFESELVDAAEEFHALAARLAALVDADTSGLAACEALPEVLAGLRLGDLATCRLVERADRSGEYAADGSSSTVAWLRNLSGESPGWCSQRVQIGRALADRMPATADAWSRGELGLAHANVIRDATSKLEDALAAEIEKVLAEAAAHLTPREVSDLAAVIKAQAAPDETTDKSAKNRAAQSVRLSKTFDDMWRLDGWLDAETGAIIAAALEAFTAKPDPELDLLAQPVGLRRADGLLQMARHAMDHLSDCQPTSGGGGQGGGRHTVIVSTSLETLQTGLGAGELAGGGILPAGAVRRLACDGGLIPAVLGADSEILDLGRWRRLFSAGQRWLMAARDGGCLFAGCDRPPSFTEAHHRDHYADGGTTSTGNADSFCTFHHHLVHEGGWTYQIIDANTLHFSPPGGGPIRISHRKALVQGDDLSKRIHPQPSVRIPTPQRT